MNNRFSHETSDVCSSTTELLLLFLGRWFSARSQDDVAVGRSKISSITRPLWNVQKYKFVVLKKVSLLQLILFHAIKNVSHTGQSSGLTFDP